MSKLIKFLIVIQLNIFFFEAPKANACQIGCMKAEIAGVTDLANSLNKWADLLPGFNESFHEEVRADLRQMDVIAVNLIELLNRLYGEQLDATNSKVKDLINHAVLKIDEIGQNAISRYREALWETECTAKALSEDIKSTINEIKPSFGLIKRLFGIKEESLLKTAGFDGKLIEISYLYDSESSKLVAKYKLLESKLSSALDNTKMIDVMNTSSDLQLLAFQNHCKTRAALSKPKYGHFYKMWVDSSKQYSDLFFIYNPVVGI